MATAGVAALRGFIDLSDDEFNRVLRQAETRATSSSAKMNRAFSSIDRKFSSVGRSIGRSAAAMAKSFIGINAPLAVLAGGAGLGLLLKKSLDTADGIAKAADAIGIGTDALQEYRHAADLAGVSTDQLDNSFKFATKAIGELRTRTSSELTTALKDFDAQLLQNIKTADLVEHAIDLVFRRMGELEDATQRAALAKAVFGRQGIILTNIVRDGAGELDRMRKEARDLGLVMDESLLRNAEKAKDQLSILGRVIGAQVTTTIIRLAPEITELSQRFIDGLPAFIQWVEEFSKWAGLIERLPQEKLDRVKDLVAEAGRARGLGADNPITSLLNDLLGIESVQAKLIDQQRQLGMASRHPQLAALPAPPTTAGAAATATITGAITPPKPKAKPVDPFIAELQSLRSELDPTGASLETYRQKHDLLDQALQKGMITATQYSSLLGTLNTEFATGGENAEAMAEATAAQAEAQQKLAETQSAVLAVIRETETAQDAFNRRIEELKALEPHLPPESYARALQMARQELENAEFATDELAQGIDTVLNSAIDGNIQSWEDLGRVGIGVLQDLIREMVQTQSTALSLSQSIGSIFSGGASLLGLFGGTGGSGINVLGGPGGSPTLFGGPRRHGGPVQAGRTFLVGEAGPELFRAPMSGHITPAEAFGGGGDRIQVVQHLNISTGVAQTVRAEIMSLRPVLRSDAMQAVLDAKQRGGRFGSEFGR